MRNPRINVVKGDQYHATKAHLEGLKEFTPVYQSQEFIMPKSLTKAEKEIWEWLVKIFRDTTNCMVSDADVHLMELYCRAKVATDEANEELKKDSRQYVIVTLGKDKDGTLRTTAKINPNFKKRHDNALLCLKYFDQLGLSPLARAKAGIKGTNARKEENLFLKIMERSDD